MHMNEKVVRFPSDIINAVMGGLHFVATGRTASVSRELEDLRCM